MNFILQSTAQNTPFYVKLVKCYQWTGYSFNLLRVCF